MGVTCCMCGAEKISGCSRSFHRIPKETELEKKWLEVIGRNITYEARVCSDHFKESDFSSSSKLKRTLLRSAVPMIYIGSANASTGIVNEGVNRSNHTDANCKTGTEHVDCLSVADSLIDPIQSEFSTDPNTMHDASSEEKDIPLSDEDDTNNENAKDADCVKRAALKRKSDDNTAHDHSKKIFLDLPDKAVGFLTRNDFTSDRAWELFMKSIIHNRKNSKVSKQQLNRLKNKISNLNGLLEKLENQNLLSSSAADSIKVS